MRWIELAEIYAEHLQVLQRTCQHVLRRIYRRKVAISSVRWADFTSKHRLIINSHPAGHGHPEQVGAEVEVEVEVTTFR